MSKKQELTSEYVLDLLHLAFKKDKYFEIIAPHLKYPYLTLDHEKEFWRKALQIYRLKNKVPSLGVIQVELRRDEKVKDFIIQLRNHDVSDELGVIDSFQNFIKESKFVEIFEKAGELYNRRKEDEAFNMFIRGAEDIHNFSIRDKSFKSVFKDFEERNSDRLIGDDKHFKVPFFIDKMDEITRGGPESGETVLFMAESGMGKSQALIHYAVQTARRGGKAVIFQIEGTERQVMDRLDAAWTGTLYHDMKKGNIEDVKFKKLKRVLSRIKGEVYVEAFEKFGSITCADIRRSVKDLKKIHGEDLELVLIDYLELLELGDGISYGPKDERHRQQKIGRFMKELAMEENIVVATVTQASNLPSELKKDPSFVMTREFLSEDKGKIRPFDFFFTFNQTYDEMKYEDETTGDKSPIMRIYADKMREYGSGQVMPIITNFDRARFYDRKKTLYFNSIMEDFDE